LPARQPDRIAAGAEAAAQRAAQVDLTVPVPALEPPRAALGRREAAA